MIDAAMVTAMVKAKLVGWQLRSPKVASTSSNYTNMRMQVHVRVHGAHQLHDALPAPIRRHAILMPTIADLAAELDGRQEELQACQQIGTKATDEELTRAAAGAAGMESSQV